MKPKMFWDLLYFITITHNQRFKFSEYTSKFHNFFFKSHFTGSGLPDQAKTAKKVLKDLVNGKLLMCKLSPDYDPQTQAKINNSNHFLEEEVVEEKREIKEKKPGNEEANQEEQKKNEPTETKTGEPDEELDDEEFFEGEALENALEDDFTEEEILDLLEGKKVKGVKLNKILT